MRGFYWLIEGMLAGCRLPGGRDGRTLDDDLAWLRRQGIGALLTLTEEPLPHGALERHGLAGLHLPVDDFTAPSPAQLHAALAFIDSQLSWGHAVAAHCLMGQGRTGCVLAVYLLRSGHTLDDAIAEVRAACPGAIESHHQEEALARWAARREWVL
jgi:protein-tyrosine phosphatase